MQGQTQQPPRNDSPGGHRYNLAYASRSGMQFIHTHQQSLYNNPSSEPSTEFSPFTDGDAQASSAPFDSTAFRNNSMLGSFASSRMRQSGAPPSAGFSQESNSMPYNQFNSLSAADVFGTHQSLAQLQQQQQQSAAARGFDYLNEAQTSKPNGKTVFANMDPFNATPGGAAGSAMTQSHQMTKPPQSQAQQQQQQHMHNFANQSFANGLMQPQQSHHQSTYGPQLPTNHSASMGGPSVSHANGFSGVSVTTQQEEISTIFVVGFPDDMQEREFQNMFTFSSGFEAATLKIPNKDSTAYGSNAPSNTGRGPYQSGYPFPGSNDPYNLQGEAGPWPQVDPNDASGGGIINPGGQPGPNPQPRKQIIGFAKFRTRSEALQARDLLQGRRIDIEKGAVLKAEMAKKNLHTKRGVGPLGPPLSVNAGPSGGNVGGVMSNTMGASHNGNMGGITENISTMTGILSPGASSGPEILTARERELGTLGAMGLAGLTRRDRLESDDDRDNRRRRDFGSVNSLANNLSMLNIQATRGPRERLEEDERERRRKEKEAERNRLRAGNQAAYDAFHSVASAQRNQLLSGLGSPESLNALPFSAGLFSPQESVSGHSMDGWPVSAPANAQRLGNLGNLGSAGISGISGSRSTPLGINTNFNRPTPSQETSPTEPTAGPASVSSRSGASDHGVSHEAERFSPTPAVSLSSHPSMSSLSSRSRPYSPTGDAALTLSSVLSSLPEQQVPANQGQGFPPASASSASSVSGSRSSTGSADEDISRTIGNIDVNLQQGAMSPQLPSPNSGTSSGQASRGNPSDQNPPINTLYVGNLPTSPVPGNQPNLLEDGLRSLFSRCPGYRKLCFRQKSNGPMCFVEFEDVNYATKALSELYGHTLNGLVKGGIRLSYSKNPLGVRTPTNTGNGNSLQQGLQSFGTSGAFSSIQDAFARHSAAGVLSIDMNVIRGMRRDGSEVTSPSQYFASSPPPPRFFSPPPSSGFNYTGQANAPGLARSNNSSYASTFSPFGPNTPPETATHPADSEPTTEPVKSTYDFSSTPGLDSSRSG